MAGRRKLNDEMCIASASAAGTPGTADGPVADSDGDLLRRHVAGDPEAFGTLFLRHKERLWAIALRTTCDPEDAADALQEAMVSAFRRAADFRGDSAVTTWLYRIVVNAAVDRMRRRPSRTLSWSGEEAALDMLLAQGTADAGRPPGLAPVTDPMETTEVRLDVSAALRQLPEHQRIALVLVDMMGYHVAEVGEMLGVSAGTVKSRCARGRARLLPFLSHLRTSAPIGGNRPGAISVSSEQEGDA